MTSLTPRLSDVLERLGYSEDQGTLSRESADAAGTRDFVWRDVQQRCRVDAAYFRGAAPLIAFIETETPEHSAQAQQRLWNFGRVPILVAVTGDEVRAMSCALAPSPNNPDATTLARHQGGGDMHTLDAFRRHAVARGQPSSQYATNFNGGGGVHARLLKNLRDLQSRLGEAGVENEDVERIIGRSIFVRFLEDRKILTTEHLAKTTEFDSFLDILQSSPVHLESLFQQLADRFNGDAFGPPLSARSISLETMGAVSDFLSGGTVASGQQSFIPYDFSIIPADLVSSVYEQLLHKQRRASAAHYTPRAVVDLMLDEVLPLDVPHTEVRILDPSCGSGIFLSEAFRRLVYRASVTERPSFDDLKTLLSTSIFGIDVSSTAVGVASFGLDLALLEHVDPPTAWEGGRLPSLVGENLQISDYFDSHPFTDMTFDLVVGNPPWQSTLSALARTYVDNHDPPISIPDNQLAAAFLWRSIAQLGDSGKFALVLPAKTLLHNRSTTAKDFRSQLYSRTSLDVICDLSPLRHGLFGSASAPAAIAIGSAQLPAAAATDTLFLSPRESPLSRMLSGIVFSSEDIHVVPLTLAERTPDIWKTLLWGTYADVEFVRTLREASVSLAEFARDRNWTVGQGFQVKGGDRNSAQHLQGLPILPVGAVEPMVIKPVNFPVVHDPFMHRPRTRDVFLGPHILLRKGFGSVPVSAFSSEDLAHPDSIFGICSSASDADLLRAITAILNSSLAQYYYFMTSSSWGVEREQLQLAEYLTLPLPELSAKLVQSLAGLQRSVRSDGSPRAWQAELDSLVFAGYGLTPGQRDLVSEAIELRMSQYLAPTESPAFSPVDPVQLEAYCSTLAANFGLFVPSLAMLAQPRGGGGSLLAVSCALGGDDPEDASTTLAALSESNQSSTELAQQHSAVVEPTALVMSGSTIHIVKPNERRFWSRSVARDDCRAIIAAAIDPDMVPTQQEA